MLGFCLADTRCVEQRLATPACSCCWTLVLIQGLCMLTVIRRAVIFRWRAKAPTACVACFEVITIGVVCALNPRRDVLDCVGVIGETADRPTRTHAPLLRNSGSHVGMRAPRQLQCPWITVRGVRACVWVLHGIGAELDLTTATDACRFAMRR